MAADSGRETVASEAAQSQKDDRWMLAALGALGYIVSNVLHEGLGHGGAAWLSGARRIVVTSTYMEAGLDTRWILAAGTLANLVFGVVGLWVLAGMRRAGMSLRLFVWSVTAFNLLLGTGYFLFSGVAGVGDWAEWMKGLSPLWGWRVGFAVLGAVSYFVSAWLLARELARIVGAGEARLRRMTWTIYFAGCVTACLAGARNPMGWRLVLLSAAASSLGGASGLLWIPSVAGAASRGCVERGAIAPPLRRRMPVYVTAAVLFVAYVWVLGAGVVL